MAKFTQSFVIKSVISNKMKLHVLAEPIVTRTPSASIHTYALFDVAFGVVSDSKTLELSRIEMQIPANNRDSYLLMHDILQKGHEIELEILFNQGREFESNYYEYHISFNILTKADVLNPFAPDEPEEPKYVSLFATPKKSNLPEDEIHAYILNQIEQSAKYTQTKAFNDDILLHMSDAISENKIIIYKDMCHEQESENKFGLSWSADLAAISADPRINWQQLNKSDETISSWQALYDTSQHKFTQKINEREPNQ